MRSSYPSCLDSQVWVLAGEMEITLDNQRYRLREGDCLAMQLDTPKIFYNPTRKTTRYAVVVTTLPQ